MPRLKLSKELFTSLWRFFPFKDMINPLQLFILLMSYGVLGYHFEQVILSILNLNMLVQQFIICYIFISIKETNMALLFDVFKHLQLRKTDVLKTFRKSKFFGEKIQGNALALKNKKVQGIFGKTFILTLSSAVFYLQNRVSDFFSIVLFGR